MARIKTTTEIPLSDLVIAETQARVRDVEKEIDELAESIRLHGLLEPIVVCPDVGGGYQVLMGQRRLLAHKKLGRSTILAAIVDEPIDDVTAKVLSLSENMIRQDLDPKDVIDACTALYKKYGNAKAVAEETGLPYPQVLRHVKYDRLVAPMRALVDSGEVGIGLALQAQDVATANDKTNEKEAVELARELSPLTSVERRQILREKQNHSQKPISVLLKETRGDSRSKQIIVTLATSDLRKLQAYAKAKGITQDQAAAGFVVEGLSTIESLPAQREERSSQPARKSSEQTPAPRAQRRQRLQPVR